MNTFIEGKAKKIEGKRNELLSLLDKIIANQSAIDITQLEYSIFKKRINLLKQDLKQAEKNVSLHEMRYSS